MLLTSSICVRFTGAHRAPEPSLQRRSSGNALPLALVGAALVLSACGGGSSGSNGSGTPPAMDADQNQSPFSPVQGGGGTGASAGGGSSGALVPSGQFAGLDQSCVDTLLDIDPNAPTNLIQLTCRPENIDDDDDDDDSPFPVAGPIVGNPTDQGPVFQPPGNTPPIATPGLNIAPADVAGASYYQNSRVSALMTGPLFGAGTRPNEELVKPLAVQIGNVGPGLNLLELRAVRDSFGPVRRNADYLAVVQNTSSDFHCSITLDDIGEFSASGQQITTDSLSFSLVSGEIGVAPNDDFYFSSCLAPGSLGYMLSFRDANFDDVAEVRSGRLRSNTRNEQVAGSVLPISYSVNADGSVSITIVNNHSLPLDVRAVDALAIDEQGHAFSWDLELAFTVVAPGEELIVDGFFARFEGSASAIRAIVDFDLPD